MLPWFLHPGAFSSKQHSPPPNPQLGPTYRAPISSKNHSQNSCVLFAQDEQGDLSLAVAEAIREGRWASLLAEPSVFFLARRVITASSPRSPESVNRASDRSLSLTPSPPSRAAKTSRSAPARIATKPKRSAAPPPPPLLRFQRFPGFFSSLSLDTSCSACPSDARSAACPRRLKLLFIFFFASLFCPWPCMRAERGFRCAGWVGKTGAKVTVRSRTFFFGFSMWWMVRDWLLRGCGQPKCGERPYLYTIRRMCSGEEVGNVSLQHTKQITIKYKL